MSDSEKGPGNIKLALDSLIRQNASLRYRLALAESRDQDDAQQEAAVSAVLAVAAASGLTADTLPDEDVEEVLEQVDAEFTALPAT